jgi:hypothetical protein
MSVSPECLQAIDAIIANFMIWHLHGFKAACFHTSALIFCTGGNSGANLTFLGMKWTPWTIAWRLNQSVIVNTVLVVN